MFHSESINSCHITYLAMQDEYTMTADEKEARDLKRAMMSDDFPEGPDGDIEARKIFVGEQLLTQGFVEMMAGGKILWK